VQRIEKSNVLMLLQEEKDLDCMYPNRSFEFFPTTLTKEEILENPRSVLCSIGISTKDEELDLPSLYWIPKSHKCPFKQRYFASVSGNFLVESEWCFTK
jgi:hypothetical protein